MQGNRLHSETIVDLFCGCGGFSLGAELAGFQTGIAIDIDPALQSSFKLNFPMASPLQGSVTDIQASDWRRLLGGVRPAGVIGGPPCQGFSWIGQRKELDPRNSLIGEFFRHVSILRPKFFVMENVDGLLHKDKIRFLTEALTQVDGRYVILDPLLVNASDFGAPTNRKRVMVIGYDPCEVEAVSASDFFPRAARISVADAIRDLPAPIDVDESCDYGWASYPSVSTVSQYAKLMRQLPVAGLGSELARRRLSQGYVSGLATTKHSDHVAKRYQETPAGKADPTSKSVKLSWDGLCPTLRAGTGQEKGAHQAVRPLHPDQGRVISVREAARLQGFPDWFLFHKAKWHSFRMIGNSVSPLVSQGVLSILARKMALPLAA